MRLPEEFRARTKKYASATVRLYVKLPRRRKEVEVLGHQLLRSGTSVAAHTREASRARSDAEFCSKIDGALQEADESQLWIELLHEDCGINGLAIDHLHQEAGELIAILTTMARNTRRTLR
jgi:four helix bundle protein